MFRMAGAVVRIILSSTYLIRTVSHDLTILLVEFLHPR